MTRQNNGLRKRCDCPRRAWAKCPHDWHFNFKLRNGKPYRFSLDRELGRPLKNKAEAEIEARRIRDEIRAGTFQQVHERAAAVVAPVVAPPAPLTLEVFAATYVERVSEARERNKSWKDDRYELAQLAAFQRLDGTRLGTLPLEAITDEDLELFFLRLRQNGRAASTRNGYVTLVKKFFRWATKKGAIAHNPIGALTPKDADTEIKRRPVAKRARRLDPEVLDEDGRILTPSEEHRLLAVAPAHVQSLIIGAIETCCRRGELLALQWADVNLPRRLLRVRAETAKDGETREIPISARLAAVLEMLKTDPLGKEYAADQYVFGELGARVKTVKRAWNTAVLKAHGHTPIWSKKGAKLAPASRAVLQAINLHFHDLRHEGGSRLLEAGWPLHHVQEMLGHASIGQTSTYLNVAKGGLQDSMRKSDEARTRCTLLHANTESGAAAGSSVGQENAAKVTVN